MGRETKLHQMNKMLVASNELKDRVIRDLRTEIIEKSQKIEHLKAKVRQIKAEMQDFVSEIEKSQEAERLKRAHQNVNLSQTMGSPNARGTLKYARGQLNEKIKKYNSDMKIKQEEKAAKKEGSHITKLDLSKVQENMLVSSKNRYIINIHYSLGDG